MIKRTRTERPPLVFIFVSVSRKIDIKGAPYDNDSFKSPLNGFKTSSLLLNLFSWLQKTYSLNPSLQKYFFRLLHFSMSCFSKVIRWSVLYLLFATSTCGRSRHFGPTPKSQKSQIAATASKQVPVMYLRVNSLNCRFQIGSF